MDFKLGRVGGVLRGCYLHKYIQVTTGIMCVPFLLTWWYVIYTIYCIAINT
jgi:hypothetical protein